MEARFFASVFPVDPSHLSSRGGDYDSIDFDFHDYGAITADGICWAAVDLPNYPIDGDTRGSVRGIGGRVFAHMGGNLRRKIL